MKLLVAVTCLLSLIVVRYVEFSPYTLTKVYFDFRATSMLRAPLPADASSTFGYSVT